MSSGGFDDGFLTWARSVAGSGAEPERVIDSPWSTVVRLRTAEGLAVWAKRNCAAFRSEAVVLDVLTPVAGDVMLAPLAIEPENGWLLLPDGGPTAADEPPDERAVVNLLIRYATFQRRSTAFVDALLHRGVLDMRPAAMPEWFERCLDHSDCPAAARSLREPIRDWADELSAYAIPATIQHDDLTSRNVLRGPPMMLFDWGDACVANPFASHTSLRRSAVSPAGWRDAHLAGWSEIDNPIRDRAARLAVLLGHVTRAVTWLRAPPEAAAHYPGAFATWIERLLDEAAIEGFIRRT